MEKYELSPAEKQIFDDNLNLVDYTIYKFFKYSTISSFGSMEAKSAGCLGLVKAIKRFDETKGTKFSSYAISNIRYNIMNALRMQKKIGEYDCVEAVRETETFGKRVKGCRRLIVVDYFTPIVDEISDMQAVDSINELAKNELKEAYFDVYKEYYIDGRTIAEIATGKNISRARVYQILRKSIAKLKSKIEEKKLFE